MLDFTHLHCHTQYSLLDGAARIKTLITRAAEMEMKALAITDHGNLYGVPEFYTTAKKAGILPVIGSEFYLAPSGLYDRNDRTRYHQVLLAKNEEGYRNLIRLSSIAFTDGYYYKPRIDRETLKKHASGLVATTCCLQGEVPQLILKRGEDAAREVFEWYLDLFGDDYYIEIQDHGITDQKRVNAVLLRWAKEYNVKIIATNDVHYVEKNDAAAQDVLLCLQTGKELNDPNRMRFDNSEFYLKSADEMQSALTDLEPDAREVSLTNTVEVAEKCSFELPMGKLLMPHYPIPAEYGGNMGAYLRHLVFEGAKKRYPGLPQNIVDRLNYELDVIQKMGFEGYFLIVQDFTTAARKLNVSVGPGRGSAAGSCVAYCLGITNIDPLRYDLLFERFLNPERVSMPDIDIDFDDRGRGKVIDYVVQKYGRENVCQIITFGTMGARSVIRDVGRVLNIPLAETDRIAKMIPEGPKVTLDTALQEVPEFRKLQQDPNPQIRKLIHYARVLEGSARHTGVHAAGVIIAPGKVSDYVPVAVAKGKTASEDVVTTQYDGKWVESFGLLKMDFLGLKTLTLINDTLQLIEENHGIKIDVDAIPLDDQKTFELFQRGETVSIFQFESSGMREWMRKLKPTHIDDLIAMNALYRPGPMEQIPHYIARKQGLEKVEYPHEMLKPILEPTFGIPVYQEQVMQMAQVMGGYTLGGADILRRAMGKKKKEEMDKQRAIFVKGAAAKGVSEAKANEVFDLMAAFAGYGFNKSHAAAYSVVAYQTAYLKAHYPAEFMAAAMTNEMGDTKKLSVVLEEARHMGIELLPPSINHSHAHFTVENGKVRFGLGAIKGVGLGAIEAIVSARKKKGPFKTIFGLTREIDLRVVNKKALECLVRVGAMDCLEGHRAQLAAAIDNAVQYGQKVQADRAAGQSSLFGGSVSEGTTLEPNLPVVPPWPRSVLLKHERELIGFYVSGHPLEAYTAEVRAFATASLGDVERLEQEMLQYAARNGHTNGYGNGNGFGGPRGPVHSFIGIVTDVQRRSTKTGKPMLFASIEDFEGQGEVVCFSSVFDRVQHYVQVDEILLVKGEVEVRGGAVKIVAQDVFPMWKVHEQLVRSILFRIPPQTLDVKQIDELRALCDAHRGQCKVYFDIEDPALPGGRQRIRARKYVLEPTVELMQGVTRILGKDNIILEGE
jgi:DNA polymerase-3 subunit alpha